VQAAVAARMNWNRILGSGNHRFALLVEETVLRYRIGSADVMAGQRLPGNAPLAHMLGFGGHFLTKARRYTTTPICALRQRKTSYL
jgi:Domain of unknown function (DUF5753)